MKEYFKDYFTINYEDGRTEKIRFNDVETSYDMQEYFDQIGADEEIELMRIAENMNGVRSDKWKRLDSCKAWVYEAHREDVGDVWFLKSYNTVMAVYHEFYNVVYIYRKYSRTTSMHVTRFKRWLRKNGIGRSGMRIIDLGHLD